LLSLNDRIRETEQEEEYKPQRCAKEHKGHIFWFHPFFMRREPKVRPRLCGKILKDVFGLINNLFGTNRGTSSCAPQAAGLEVE
jgi:hypothetical protein